MSLIVTSMPVCDNNIRTISLYPLYEAQINAVLLK